MLKSVEAVGGVGCVDAARGHVDLVLKVKRNGPRCTEVVSYVV
jgi:hypothetical protein